MARKPIELPPEVARKFVEDMRAYLKEPSELKRDVIAARQMHILNEHARPGDKPVRIPDVREMFERMRNYLGR